MFQIIFSFEIVLVVLVTKAIVQIFSFILIININ